LVSAKYPLPPPPVLLLLVDQVLDQPLLVSPMFVLVLTIESSPVTGVSSLLLRDFGSTLNSFFLERFLQALSEGPSSLASSPRASDC